MDVRTLKHIERTTRKVSPLKTMFAVATIISVAVIGGVVTYFSLMQIVKILSF